MRLLLLLLFSVVSSAAAEATLFDYSSSAEFKFSSVDSLDALTVDIVGTSCEAADFTIEVVGADGELAYRFERPLKYLIPCMVLEKGPEEQVKELCTRLVMKITSKGVAKTTSGLPEKQEPPDYPAFCSYHDEYDSLRERNLGMLCHAVTHEASTCVAWDPKMQEVVKVLTCGF